MIRLPPARRAAMRRFMGYVLLEPSRAEEFSAT